MNLSWWANEVWQDQNHWGGRVAFQVFEWARREGAAWPFLQPLFYRAGVLVAWMLVEAPAGVMFHIHCLRLGRGVPMTELFRMNRLRRRALMLLAVVFVLTGYLVLPHAWDFRVPALLGIGLWVMGTRVI